MMGGFLPSLKRVSYLPCDGLRKDNIRALQETVKARMPTIAKQALRYGLGFSRIWNVTNSHKYISYKLVCAS